MKILEYPELEICESGTIRKVGFGPLKPLDNGRGYKFIAVIRNGKQKNLLIHRLVASAYLELNLSDVSTQVNHINGDKSDNRVCNLELCTGRQNVNRGFARLKGLVEFEESSTEIRCRKCLELKDVSDYSVSRKRLSGYRAYCKQCEATITERIKHE